MFNPVQAPFAGTVKAVRLEGEGGQLVQKGQVLFELEPDVPIVRESEAERLNRQTAVTEAYLAWL